jgi:hypothetical protein
VAHVRAIRAAPPCGAVPGCMGEWRAQRGTNLAPLGPGPIRHACPQSAVEWKMEARGMRMDGVTGDGRTERMTGAGSRGWMEE